jgi:hypothetical protein
VATDLANQNSNRAHDYMQFCKEWNSRTLQDPDHPPDPAEFDQFFDIIAKGNWSARMTDKKLHKITDAPLFCPGDEVSWQLVEFDQIP